MDKEILNKLIRVVGSDNIILNKSEMSKYLIEWRGVYTGKAGAIIKPKSTKEISKILKIAYSTNTPIISQGGNTGLVGGQISFDDNHIVLNLTRLNKVREINTLDKSITVESGLTLLELQNVCKKNSTLFPLSLASEGTCTIGGNISTNAGGVGVLYYGNTRNLVLGLEIVTPEGKIINTLSTLIKDNTGYSLKDLFIGSEGTLGVITAATLKVFPLPKEKYTGILKVKSPQKSIKVLRFIQENISTPLTAFELMNKFSINFVKKNIPGTVSPFNDFKWIILIEFSSLESSNEEEEKIQNLLGKLIKTDLVEDAVIAGSIRQSNEMWKLRESISEAQKAEGGSIKNDISVPIKFIDKFIRTAISIINKIIPNSRCVIFGHIGDGNIHFNISQPIKFNKKDFLKKEGIIRREIVKLTMKLEGSFSAEHGVGVARKADLKRYKKDELIIMKGIKESMDRKNIMNPGKIIDC